MGATEAERTCCDCTVTKPIGDFYFHAKTKPRPFWDVRCKPCTNVKWRKARVDNLAGIGEPWATHGPDKYRVRKKSKLKYLYGLTIEAYDAMVIAQDDRCYLCRKPETAFIKGKRRKLAVEHNHATGKVRGLACFKCNSSLPFVEDRETLIRVIAALHPELLNPDFKAA